MARRHWLERGIVAALLVGGALSASAQEAPRIGYLYPAGGQRGTSVEVAVGGRYLGGAKDAEISGTGVVAKVLAYVPRMSGPQVAALRTKERDLERKQRAAVADAAKAEKQTAADQARYQADLKRWENEKTKYEAAAKERRALIDKQKQAEAARQAAIKAGNKPATTAPATAPAPKPLPPLRAKPRAIPPTRPKILWTPRDEEALAATRKTLSYAQQRRSSQWIGETVVLEITLAADAAPGERQVRLVTRTGVSNARVFCVGEYPEAGLPANLSSVPPAPPPKLAKTATQPAPPATEPSAPRIVLPVVVNGQIMPGAVNRYRFAASRGQRLVVATTARRLVPFMPDAVPGWFQALISIHDAAGKCLAAADSYRFDPDPVILFEVPADGEYVLQVRDSIYRGREDFVYRVTIGQVPFVTGAYPLGSKCGAPTTVQLTGWNLPAAQITPDTSRPGVQVLGGGVGSPSAAPRFAVDTLPECMKEKRKDAAAVQKVSYPTIINGRIDAAGEWDFYRFTGRAGAQVVIDVQARRLGSPLDSVVVLNDSHGKRVGFNDDFEDQTQPLATHQADSHLLVTLPADDEYVVGISDAQRAGGPAYAYRLRISPPQPDFALRVVPSSIAARSGTILPLAVHAVRKEGFAGRIDLALTGAPAETILSGGVIPAGQEKVRLTLMPPPVATKEPAVLVIEGRASIDGQAVVRNAVAADDMMQAFIYHHLVPAGELKLVTTGVPTAEPPMRVVSEGPVVLSPGKVARLRIVAPALQAEDALEFQLSEPPEGVSISSCSADGRQVELTLQCDGSKAKTGVAGNLIITGVATRIIPPAPPKPAATAMRLAATGTRPAATAAATSTAPASAPAPPKPPPKPVRRKIQLGYVPAVPFELVP